jgi:integrase
MTVADTHAHKLRTNFAFTDKAIRGLKPAHEIYELRDLACPGLVLRVTTKGRKVWETIVTEYGKRRRVRLGEYPALPLAEARRIATERKSTPGGMTYGLRCRDLWRLYHAEIADARRSIKDIEIAWRKWAEPILGDVRIEDVTLHHGVAVIDHVAKKCSRNRAASVIRNIRPMFRWAAGRGMLPGNPFAGLVLPRGAERRDRVLRVEEWQQLADWAFDEPYPFGPYVLCLMLSGQRRNEVASMEWREIDGDVWTIPTNKHKGYRNHEVPLSAPLARLIEAQPCHDSFVFSTRPETHIKPGSKLKNRISAETGLDDWRFHDIRRTAATILGDNGVPRFTIERILGHSDQSVTAVYDRARYRDEKQLALEVLAATVRRAEAHND